MTANEPTAILDVRPAADFERRHRAGTANIPLEELARRIHELPDRDRPLIVYDPHPVRARWAASRLRARGRRDIAIRHGDAWLAEGSVEHGPSRVRLWTPHALLARAVEIDRPARADRSGATAVDVACGNGRDAVFLALSGYRTTAIDHMPDALERCRDLAARNGVCVTTACRDVEADPGLAADAFDLVCVFNFLHRPLLQALARTVRPGGLIVYETFVEPQRERYGKPRRAQFVLRPGELRAAFAGFEILSSSEGPIRRRRIVASLIARKPAAKT